MVSIIRFVFWLVPIFSYSKSIWNFLYVQYNTCQCPVFFDRLNQTFFPQLSFLNQIIKIYLDILLEQNQMLQFALLFSIFFFFYFFLIFNCNSFPIIIFFQFYLSFYRFIFPILTHSFFYAMQITLL